MKYNNCREIEGNILSFENCKVCVEKRDKDKHQPAILIKLEDNKVIMVTNDNLGNFNITDETGYWDIIDDSIQYIGGK